jgi:integrase
MEKAKERDGVFQRNDRHGWWVSYVDITGKRRKQKVVAHTRKQALDALSAIKTRVEREKILGVKAASDISTEDLFARYKQYQKGRLRPSTFARLEGILSILRANFPGRAKDISKKRVADYVSRRAHPEVSPQTGTAKRGAAPGTIHKEITVLKHALKLAVEWELLHKNPAQGTRLPKMPEGRTRYLSPLELKAALEAAPEWMRRPIALAVFTGMRRGEILGIRWGDVDTQNRRLYLRDTKKWRSTSVGPERFGS